MRFTIHFFAALSIFFVLTSGMTYFSSELSNYPKSIIIGMVVLSICLCVYNFSVFFRYKNEQK